MSGINLEDCKLITGEEYCKLKDPKFKGQTRLDANKQYYMCWESEGVMYKTLNTL
jgi:hypothetical protein